MNPRWIIGLASGSSGDGVDATLLEVRGAGMDVSARLLQALHQPYGRDLRSLIERVASPGPCDTRQVSLLHRLLGETFAAAARQVADRASFSLQKVQCIGCPGIRGSVPQPARQNPDQKGGAAGSWADDAASRRG